MRGQSIIEVLIAVAIGATLMIAAAGLIAPSLKTNTQTVKIETATALGKELFDNAKVWAQGDWHNVLNVATGSANTFYLVASTSPFTATSGQESVVAGGVTYARYFYTSDAYRDSGGNVTSTASGNSYDPSTKQITVVYGPAGGATGTLAAYLTRSRGGGFAQTDWSGGVATGSAPATLVSNQFTTSTNVTVSTAGTLTLLQPVTCTQ